MLLAPIEKSITALGRTHRKILNCKKIKMAQTGTFILTVKILKVSAM